MRRALVPLFTFLAATVACFSSTQETQLLLSPLVKNNIDFTYFMADKANTEAWFCMTGFIDRVSQNALVVQLSPMWVDSSSGSHLSGILTCNPKDDHTVGVIHYHPGTGYCELSDTDISTAHRSQYEHFAFVCRDSSGKLSIRSYSKEAVNRYWASQDSISIVAKSDTAHFKPTYRYRP